MAAEIKEPHVDVATDRLLSASSGRPDLFSDADQACWGSEAK